jgi:hypothetical protein
LLVYEVMGTDQKGQRRTYRSRKRFGESWEQDWRRNNSCGLEKHFARGLGGGS